MPATLTKRRRHASRVKPSVRIGPSRPASSAPKAPESPYAWRLERLRGLMTRAGVDYFLVTNPLDVGYLSGFLGGESYLLVGPGRPIIISDFRYDEELEPQRALCDIIIRKKPILEAAADVIRQFHASRCGIQAEFMPVADMTILSAQVGENRVKPVDPLVGRLRVVKDEFEIGLIRTALKIQQDALKAILKALKPGVTELEVAARLEGEMKARGSSQPGFQSIVGSGAGSALPHYRPGKVKIARNKVLLIDWGATYRGYQGDMTRTFAFRKWPGKFAEIYRIVLDAQEMAASALAPGQSTHVIDGIARAYINKHGYGDKFGHGLGHGLGLSKEPPYLNPLYPPINLEVGHVCTVEPGIYLPGQGGVRIEDMYVITERGAQNLCSMPKDPRWATL